MNVLARLIGLEGETVRELVLPTLVPSVTIAYLGPVKFIPLAEDAYNTRHIEITFYLTSTLGLMDLPPGSDLPLAVYKRPKL